MSKGKVTVVAPAVPEAAGTFRVGTRGAYRVCEADGSACMVGREPADGGGLDHDNAHRLTDLINARRAKG